MMNHSEIFVRTSTILYCISTTNWSVPVFVMVWHITYTATVGLAWLFKCPAGQTKTMCRRHSQDGPKLFLCCNESCTVGLVLFYVPWKIQQLCALSALLATAQAQCGLCLGIGPLWEDFLAWLLSWSGALSASLLGPTRWSRLYGHRGNAENRLPAPPSGALYLMTWRILSTHTHTHSPVHTLASVCWHLTPHIDKGHMKEEFAVGRCDWFLSLLSPQNVVRQLICHEYEVKGLTGCKNVHQTH